MSFRCMHLSLVFGSVLAESWYKTITPSQNTSLCLDLPGGDAHNGNMLWLWECQGVDSQIWVFNNYQVRYGANENFCIDAGEMEDGSQLMLWECNGVKQQTWGYSDDYTKAVQIPNS